MTPAVRRWLLILRVPLALLGVFLFFAVYNRCLLDKNLQNLRTSLSVMEGAAGVGQAEAALLLVDQTLTAQMAQKDLDLTGAATLQYAQGALTSDQLGRPPDDAQILVQILGEDKAAEHPAVLMSVDGMIASAQNAFRKAALLPRQVLGRSLSQEIDTARMEEAAVLERCGRLPEAASILQGVLREYPNYAGRASLKLRLGYLFQKLNQFDRTKKLYQQVLAEARDPQEIEIARQMLDHLSGLRSRTARAKSLEKELARAGAGDRQRAAVELGCALIQASSLDQAAKAFREAYLADPKGELAASVLFKEAWCLRAAGRLEEAFPRLDEIRRRYPKTEWAAASYLQIAEIYKAVGDPRAAAEAYKQAASAQVKDAALSAIATAQAGFTYEFDLNDIGKAQALFLDLAKRFPASSFSSAGRRLEEIRIRKGRLIAQEGPGGIPAPTGPRPPSPAQGNMFASGSPLLNWLESFLPVFVSVFTDRLSKYMEAVGETELSRRFTDTEFGELVVREVQRRFPGQVSDVKTQIHPDGFVGSGNVHLAMFSFSVETKIGIQVENFRPHAILQSIKIGKISLPEPLLKLLETRINASIDQKNYPLKIREYKLNEGYAWISVEVAK